MDSKGPIYINDDLIKQLYDNVTYFDEYGTSIIIFVIVTIVVFCIVLYYSSKSKIGEIKDDWVKYRCHPVVIPFAGIIKKPYNKSIVEFTGENFTYCVDNILTNISKDILQPLELITSQLDGIYKGLGEDIHNGMKMINYIRNKYSIFTHTIMNNILNSIINLQPVLLGVKDINSKLLAGLTAGVYNFLGSFESLKGLFEPLN